jgi:hypothetical protein
MTDWLNLPSNPIHRMVKAVSRQDKGDERLARLMTAPNPSPNASPSGVWMAFECITRRVNFCAMYRSSLLLLAEIDSEKPPGGQAANRLAAWLIASSQAMG